jgi:Flp pilus assembly protein TadB
LSIEISDFQKIIPVTLICVGLGLIANSLANSASFKFKGTPQGKLLASIQDSFRSISSISGVSQRELVTEFLAKVSILSIAVFFIGAAVDGSLLVSSMFGCLSILLLIRQEYNKRAKAIKKYREILELEYANFAETLALCVNSGLPFTAAFFRASEEYVGERKISQTSPVGYLLRKFLFRTDSKKNYLLSPLQRELEIIRLKVDAGKTVSESLDQFASRINSQIISDFVDAIALSMARGTPIAFLITDHANRIREAQRRMILERAGKAEIKMMVPVVFLLLPISVLFALWPSFQQMQQMVVFT